MRSAVLTSCGLCFPSWRSKLLVTSRGVCQWIHPWRIVFTRDCLCPKSFIGCDYIAWKWGQEFGLEEARGLNSTAWGCTSLPWPSEPTFWFIWAERGKVSQCWPGTWPLTRTVTVHDSPESWGKPLRARQTLQTYIPWKYFPLIPPWFSFLSERRLSRIFCHAGALCKISGLRQIPKIS